MAKTYITSATPEQIAAAVEAKHILMSVENVTIGAKASPTGKDEKLDYVKLTALDVEGMALLADGKLEAATTAPADVLDADGKVVTAAGKDERTKEQKANGAADYFNYGFDLSVRQKVRAELAEQIEGPSKVIAKAAEQLVKAGLYDNVAEATEAVKAQRKARGLDN